MEASQDINQESTVHLNKDFRQYLQNEFLNRCRRNRYYSLRSFAKSMGVDQSLLSKLLRSKRNFTNSMIYRLGQSLGLSPMEISNFISHNGPTTYPINQVTEDVFNVIADWYHFAILELIKLKDFHSDPKWMASTLGISLAKIGIALERLERLNFIKKDENGNIILSLANNSWENNHFTTSARKTLQKHLLQLAIDSIDEVNFDFRINTNLMVACDSKLLPEIREKITNFRFKLDQFIEKQGNCDQVYNFVVAFYPVSK